MLTEGKTEEARVKQKDSLLPVILLYLSFDRHNDRVRDRPIQRDYTTETVDDFLLPQNPFGHDHCD